MQEKLEGWAWPFCARKAHYFYNGESLCGKVMYFGDVEQGNDDSPDNCMECRRRLEKIKTKRKE
jgi:hypothetical protein